MGNGILSENRRLNLYENLCLKISEIILLKIFDNNLDVGIFPTSILLIFSEIFLSIEKYT